MIVALLIMAVLGITILGLVIYAVLATIETHVQRIAGELTILNNLAEERANDRRPTPDPFPRSPR